MSCILKFRSLKISLETLERSFHREEKTEISREASWDIWNSPFWLDRSWITDPDPDHPKGTQPKFITIRILEHIDTLWNFLEFSARRDSLRCVDWLQRLKLEINCLRLQFNFFATFNCDVLFTRKGLKASKNEWIEAYMSFWTLPIPTSCKLKL